jgi:hypothetical protein
LRAIVGFAATLQRWTDRGLLKLDDPIVSASQFNWLHGRSSQSGDVFGTLTLSSKGRQQHLTQSIDIFLAAYGRK